MATTRRELLRLGAGAAASLAMPGRLPGQEDGLITRAIPNTGHEFPIIGIGTARRYDVGPEAADRAPLREVLATFTQLGGSVIDTAPSYGAAEQVCGDIVRELGNRDRLFIATKISLRGLSGRGAGIAQMQQSMTRFGTEHIDLMQIHNLNDWHTQLELIREWKEEGRLGSIGITTSFDRQYADFENVMREDGIDAIQVDYAIDNRGAEERILPLAAERRVAVLVNLPFSRGRTFERAGSRALPDWAADYGIESWAQFFLKWVISHPAVTVAIPGTARLDYLIDNLGAARGVLPDEAARRRMLSYFESL